MINKHPYEKLADDLATRIRSGEWREGQKIPGIRDFEQTYPYSRVTIQKAIDRLRELGYLDVSPRSGAFVKSMFVRDRVGLLLGGVLPDGTRSSFSSVTNTKVCAYLHRCAMDIRVYNDDPHSTLGVPRELDDDLEKGTLKSLLTIQSNFGYRYLKSERWRSHAIPHVDIGTIPTGFRVDVDRTSFITLAMKHVRLMGRKKLAVVARGTGMQLKELQALCGNKDTRVLAGVEADLHKDISREAWGFALGEQTFSMKNPPDALIVAEASVAKGMVQAGLVHGVEIPKRVMVVTLLNKPEDMFFPTPITRFTVDLETLACTAGQMLIDLTRNVAITEQTQLINPELDME